MLVPAIFLGRYRDVNSRCTRLIKKTQREGKLNLAFQELLELSNEPVGIPVEGPVPTGTDKYYLPYLLVRRAIMQGGITLAHAVQSELLETPWGGLALLGQDSDFYKREDECLRLLRWVHRHRLDLDRLGDRFTRQTSTRRSIWETSTNIHMALGHFGVSADDLYFIDRDQMLARTEEVLRNHGVPVDF
jgi:hypothetical protein